MQELLNEWVADEKVLLLTSMTLDLYVLFIDTPMKLAIACTQIVVSIYASS